MAGTIFHGRFGPVAYAVPGGRVIVRAVWFGATYLEKRVRWAIAYRGRLWSALASDSAAAVDFRMIRRLTFCNPRRLIGLYRDQKIPLLYCLLFDRIPGFRFRRELVK